MMLHVAGLAAEDIDLSISCILHIPSSTVLTPFKPWSQCSWGLVVLSFVIGAAGRLTERGGVSQSEPCL